MSANLEPFKGVIIALNACYDDNGEVDTGAVKRLARHYVDVGVRGLYVGGSTGEGMLQTPEERELTVQAVMEEVGEETTVIVHVGANSTRESIRLARHAEFVGAHAVSAVPCIYYRLGESAVEQHWQAIMDSTELPFIIYHIPQTTGFQLSTGLLARMAAQEKGIGVKISAESTYELQRFKAVGGEDFLVFNGPDEQYLAGRSIGADGGIGGSYGVMPQLFLHIERCFVQGRMEEAKRWQFRVNAIIERLAALSFYAACKEVLRLQGFQCGTPRMPLPQLREEDKPRAADIHETIRAYVAEIEAL